jgi:hypothetical protein
VKKILLVGRNQWIVDRAKEELDSENLRILGALSVEDVKQVLVEHEVDHVFIGPGLDINTRLEVIRAVLTSSDYTTLHLKDRSTGPEGGLSFVLAILSGLAELEDQGLE